MNVEWFFFRNASHAIDKAKEKLVTVCGLIPIASFEPEVNSLAEGNWPPDVCRRCLLIVGSEQTDDEPFDSAKARGYVPSRDLKGLAPLPLETL